MNPRLGHSLREPQFRRSYSTTRDGRLRASNRSERLIICEYSGLLIFSQEVRLVSV